MHQPVVQIVMRFIHVVSAVMVLGGLGLVSWCVGPAVRLLDERLGRQVQEVIQRRLRGLLWVGIGGLLISGVYQWVQWAPHYKQAGPLANALIGTKALLALILFVTVWMGGTGWIKPKPAKLLNVHLVVGVLILAVVLRYVHLTSLS